MTGSVPWHRLPALYREHALFVTASADQAGEQLACGARVIMIGGEPAAGTVPVGDDLVVDDLAALREKLAELEACPPRSAAETLPVLREIFTAQATPARLAALAKLAGLGDDVIAGRRIGVLSRAADAATAAALSAGLAGQRFLPSELVVLAEAPDAASAELSARAVTATLTGLADRGVDVRAVPVVTGGPDTSGLPRTGSHWNRPTTGNRRAGCGAPRPRPGPRGWCPGRHSANTATPTCSTWPARGSARRPTRPGTAGPATPSPPRSIRRWPGASISPPRTPVTGYASSP